MNSLVSIIIPVYNRPVEVLKAIESVEKQTYTNWEIILVDDGSKSYDYQRQIDYEKIQIINNPKNMGVSYSRNVGLQYAKGEYITFLDSDNIWEDDYLQTMISSMAHTNADVAFSLWKYVFGDKMFEALDERATVLLEQSLKKTTFSQYTYTIDAYDFLALAVLNELNYTHINAVLINRKYISQFQENLRISEDTFWIYQLLSEVKNVVFVMKPLLYFISSKDSVYQYMNRGDVIELDKLAEDDARKLIKTIADSKIAYESMFHYFAKLGDQYNKICDVFQQTMIRKSYTIVVLKGILHEKISWNEIKNLKTIIRFRYLLGLVPIPRNNIDYSMFDIY